MELAQRELSLDDPVTIAMAVLVERMRSLPKEDRNDLLELSKALFAAETDDDERSAAAAMLEILEQPRSKVVVMDLPEASGDDLGGWTGWISLRIRDAREKVGLTQTQLAERAGLPQSHISRLERGEHSPTAKTLEKIALALDIPASCFDPSAKN
jgi:DNA-binding XRE family transcriptional regulator